VIRNVKTLEWERVAPLFDTGQAMNSQRELLEFDFSGGSGKLFTDVACDFEKMISLVRDLRRFNTDALKPVVAAWRELLYQWRDLTKMDERKMEMLAKGFETRVRKLERRKVKA
jgi:isopenicillin N synthase-like dioxygenase